MSLVIGKLLLCFGCIAPGAALPTQTSGSSGSSGGSAAGSAAAALAGSWYGTLSYPASQQGEWLSHNVPFNLTIDPTGLYASVNWTVVHIPGTGTYCSHQQEDGLNVTVDSSGRFFAKGLGTGAEYYSYEATLVGGDTLADGVIYSSNQGVWAGSTKDGNFTAKKNAHQLHDWKCTVPPPPPPPGPNLWPIPANYTNGTTHTFLGPNFAFKCASADACGSRSVLKAAFARYTGLIFAQKDSSATAATGLPALLSGLSVAVDRADDSAKTLQFGMDESYTLTIPTNGDATLHAPTVWCAKIKFNAVFGAVHDHSLKPRECLPRQDRLGTNTMEN